MIKKRITFVWQKLKVILNEVRSMYIYKNNSKTCKINLKNIIKSFYMQENIEAEKIKEYDTLCERILDMKIPPTRFNKNLYNLEINLNDYMRKQKDEAILSEDFLQIDFSRLVNRIKKNTSSSGWVTKLHLTIFILINIFLELKLKLFLSKFNDKKQCEINLTLFEKFVFDITKYNKYMIFKRFIVPAVEIFKTINSSKVVINFYSKQKKLIFNKS